MATQRHRCLGGLALDDCQASFVTWCLRPTLCGPSGMVRPPPDEDLVHCHLLPAHHGSWRVRGEAHHIWFSSRPGRPMGLLHCPLHHDQFWMVTWPATCNFHSLWLELCFHLTRCKSNLHWVSVTKPYNTNLGGTYFLYFSYYFVLGNTW